ncbi:hypothetical protein [Streptomyces aurantiogriseus]|uniref:Cytochrome P450 n=1 Tax=Streptomyces aurantiogriseus TaxID=66870 RepID=A0A918FLP6_9ACTN|nr:hypothetical protein [Streptomyces aurantiogriseus]GGR52554.1 hypothetical protein GCM10010251_82070 [Streptomyces aurantiogriseus]
MLAVGELISDAPPHLLARLGVRPDALAPRCVNTAALRKVFRSSGFAVAGSRDEYFLGRNGRGNLDADATGCVPRPSDLENPDKLDLERPNNEHVGYSQGIHYCFGAPLARLEVQTAVSEFIRRVENPRLVEDPPPYRRNQIFRGPRHLLVDIDGIRDEPRSNGQP